MNIQAGCIAGSLKPRVWVTLPDVREGVYTPEEAQQIGMRFIQAGIEAERDAGTMEYLTGYQGMSEEVAREHIHGMASHREQYELGDHTEPRE